MTLTPKTLTFKRGDSFEQTLRVQLTEGPPLTDLSATAQARRASNDEEVAELDVDLRPVSATEALVVLSRPYRDTETWPLGILLIDVQFDWAGLRLSTQTFQVKVIADVTRHA
ncbi:hypothetical protein [Deinococcus cavernae]|nr:hypothetical protein [Deinococcus cavernae]